MPTVPNPPTGATAVAGNAQATITFVAPSNNGGATITGYTATSTPGSFTNSISGASAGPITVTGLANGVAYTFTVHATNSVGNSSESTASNSVTPATVPGPPTGATAVAGNQRATVSFSAPTNTGGSPVTGYTVTATDTTNSGRGGQTQSGTGSPLVVTGLTNGDNYTFSVVATNVMGNSTASGASSAVTPHTTVPDAPVNVIGIASTEQATVSWSPPANNGGLTITSYTVTATDTIVPANGGQTKTATNSPVIITGLTPGDAYTFSVTATNSLGASSASAASATVVPQSPAVVSSTPPPPFTNGSAYTITVPINLTQLTDEMTAAAGQTVRLSAQISSTSPQQPAGPIMNFSTGDPGILWVSPSTVLSSTVNAVIAAHVPNASYGLPASVQAYNAVLSQVQTSYATTLTSDQIQTAIKGLLLNVASLIPGQNTTN